MSIILVGKFNPAILSPDWFDRHSVVSGFSVKDARVEVIHPEYTEISYGENLKFIVQSEKFSVELNEEPFVKAHDIVSIIFGELLSHAPITAFGINYTIHFALDSAQSRVRLGRALAPIQPWGEWGKSLDQTDIAKHGGMVRLAMEETHPDDRKAGYRRVYIEPSVREDFVEPMVGVYMLVNDHYGIGAEVPDGPQWALSELSNCFDKSIEKSKEIVSQIMEFSHGLSR